jgi:hypothetical protein
MGTHYDLLGVTTTATDEEIKSAYRRVSKAYHPDAGATNPEKMKEVNDAHEKLTDPIKRQEYDAELRRANATHAAYEAPPTTAPPNRDSGTSYGTRRAAWVPPQKAYVPTPVPPPFFVTYLKTRDWWLALAALAFGWAGRAIVTSGTSLNVSVIANLGHLCFMMFEYSALVVAIFPKTKTRKILAWVGATFSKTVGHVRAERAKRNYGPSANHEDLSTPMK